jgi:hypothetical protein
VGFVTAMAVAASAVVALEVVILGSTFIAIIRIIIMIITITI